MNIPVFPTAVEAVLSVNTLTGVIVGSTFAALFLLVLLPVTLVLTVAGAVYLSKHIGRASPVSKAKPQNV